LTAHRSSIVSQQRTSYSFLAFASLAALQACGEAAMDGSSDSSKGGSSSLATAGRSSAGATTPGAGGTAGATQGAANDGLPCDIRKIVRERCGTCHGVTPQFGAEFSLTNAAQIREHGAHILVRTADGAEKPMPQPPFPALTDAEQSALHAYINAGAPVSTCSSEMPMASGGSGGGPSKPNDPNVTCYNITARKSAANEKFTVPTKPDLYHCFNYAPPWGSKKVHMVSARPIIDNGQVLHHWLLYNGEAAAQDGTSGDCVGAHPNYSMVAGWAPGGDSFEAPADVGLELASGSFSLELHYNNSVGEGQLDGSGVEVCVTDKLRPNNAATHWLGTEALNKTEAVGTCRPTNQGDVTILTSTPHMHVQGRHMKTVINRAAGGTEVLIDEPFDFNTQISYKTPAVIKKGDTLTTTCTYATPTPFGQGTNEEMCYNFVMAYPAGGLAQTFQVLRKYDCAGLF
jgi:mono/diheme cytochrome c family protein